MKKDNMISSTGIIKGAKDSYLCHKVLPQQI